MRVARRSEHVQVIEAVDAIELWQLVVKDSVIEQQILR